MHIRFPEENYNLVTGAYTGWGKQDSSPPPPENNMGTLIKSRQVLFIKKIKLSITDVLKLSND